MNPFLNPALFLRASAGQAPEEPGGSPAGLEPSVSMAELGQQLRERPGKSGRRRRREPPPEES